MKIIVAICGASGIEYGVELLKALKEGKVETHLVMSEWAERLVKEETNYKIEEVKKLATKFYENRDMAAPISSSSFLADGMAIMPCSLKTASEIANAHCGTLIARAADNCLKMRKKLVLGIRETPLSTPALEALHKCSLAGAVVMPLSPGFYHRPKGIKDLYAFIVVKALDLLEIKNEKFRRWGE